MMKNHTFICSILLLLSTLACQKQSNTQDIAQKAVVCYCNCLNDTINHTVENFSALCEDKVIENDSFMFLRVVNRWESSTDERLFQQFNAQYIRGRDSCFKSIAKNQALQTDAPNCLISPNHAIKIRVHDSLQGIYPVKTVASTPEPVFYCYYNACIQTEIGTKYIQKNYRSILSTKKQKIARTSSENIDIWVDTTQYVYLTSKSIYYRFQFAQNDSLILAYPVFLYNHSDSILSCGKASILLDVQLEEYKNKQWVTVATPPSNLCTPQPEILLYPHHVILSKIAISPSCFPRRICLYEGKNKICSNVF